MLRLVVMVWMALCATTVFAEEPAPPPEAVDQAIENLKQQVMTLNRDLFVLEEELLYPASTQVSVFLGVDVGELFKLDAVELKIDDQVVTHYLYTDRELAALRRGGVQRLYLGNLRAGKHTLTAFFTGLGPHDREYKRATTLDFDKGEGGKYIELRIKDNTQSQQPDFVSRVWE